jgi:hypothetical protein
MKRLSNFLRLSAAERRLLFRVAFLLEAIGFGLRLLPFQILRRFLGRLAESPTRLLRVDEFTVDEVVRAVEVASRHLPGTKTCLAQALAAQVLLSRREQPALVRIGVARGEGGEFEAHAWVEIGGRVVIGGRELERYVLLTALDGRS